MRTSLTLSTLFIGTLLNAQTLTTYTDADGLPSSNCRDVVALAGEQIWVATAAGVAFFDGTGFTVHNTTSHPGLADNSINAIAVAADGTVWVGTDFGVSVFDGTSYTTYTTADGLASDQIRNIKQAPNGDVWIGTNLGATKYDGSTFTNYSQPDVPFGGVNHFAFDSNGDVWMAGGLSGIMIYDGSAFSYITQNDGLISPRINSIALGNSGRWIGTAKGVTQLDASNQVTAQHTTLFELPTADTLNPVTDVVLDQNGYTWAGVYVDYLVTEGGVSYFDGNDWGQLESSDGLAGPNVRRLSVSPENNIWVTTSTGLTVIRDVNISVTELTAHVQLRAFPNPFTTHTRLLFSEALTSAHRIELLDVNGRVHRSLLATGAHELVLDREGLASGLYLVRVSEQGRNVGSVRVVVE
ncbi:MAG: T9SS type A sorting domain-containing protein [Flavobacteriales bacterium]|nr:T9SS type A sorting domain-containing protein [Flavobacteriales bacterium]